MRDLDDLFAALQRSRFRARVRLEPKDQAYLDRKGLSVALAEARRFVVVRLAPAEPPNDGKQTPLRGHPAFVAQHATATCCRGCLAKWHRIPQGRPLAENEIDYVVRVLHRWLAAQARSNQPIHGSIRQMRLF